MRINRLLQIVLYLIKNENVTVKQLSERFEVSRKTIYKDLEVLITSGIPVVYGEDMSGKVEMMPGYHLFQALESKQDEKKINKETQVYKKYIDNSQLQKKVGEVWTKYTRNITTDLSDLKPEIAHSWLRCKQLGVSTHEVDIDNLVKPEDVDKYNIEKVLSNNEDVKLFASFFKKVNWYACICDTEGRLVYLINPMEDYHIIYPQVGYNIDASEAVIGTNGVSTALAENKACMVVGTEHYNQSFHQVSCVAAPIYDDKEMVGVLNLSFVHTSVNDQVKNMAVSIARLYEALVLHRYNDVILLNSERSKNGDMTYKKQLINIPTIISESSHMKRVLSLADAIVDTNMPLSIIGSEGVGKKTLAKYIHLTSNRKYGPYKIVDCSQLEDEKEMLFGLEDKGKLVEGLLDQCNGGSLILENVSTLSDDSQALIRKFCSSGLSRRRGSKKWRSYDVRLFMVIRQDEIVDMESYHEFEMLSLPIMDLKDRKEDLNALVSHYYKKYRGDKSLIEMQELVSKMDLKANVKSVKAIFKAYNE